jgi:hypothetical protein
MHVLLIWQYISEHMLAFFTYETQNEEIPELDVLSLNFDQIFTGCKHDVNIRKTNNTLLGMNILLID